MKTVVRVVLAVMVLAAAPLMAHAQVREVLPTDVRPQAYDLHLIPDAEHLTFKGEVKITVDIAASTNTVTLNANRLSFDRAVIDADTASARVALDSKLQRATLTFAKPIAKGRHVLTIDYHGDIGKTTLGFFAMDYDTAAGKRRTLATNFEPASERDFMPSWDEPGLKANFTLTVDAPENLLPVSNMPIASSEKLAGGLARTHFQTSPKMSTYLIYFGLGDWERITNVVDGVTVGVVVPRGETEKGRYALGEASRILHFYNDWFGTKYPLPKLDLIAAPGEIQGGSMENWGAIFYSSEHLLFDPKFSTESDRQLVFLVVAHEMAHQWFGDLVTMAWWDNLWLNEGFARWMQTKAAVELHPEWRTGLQAMAIYDGGKRADAGAGTHPIVQPVLTAEQADEAFDSITYNKGAAVITMLEAYAGPDNFREGVRRYMKAHAYGNTVDVDLWSQVQAASGKPILEIEHDFTAQTGLPLLRVTQTPSHGGAEVLISTGRFFANAADGEGEKVPLWHIPLTLEGENRDILLTSGNETRQTAAHAAPVLVNAGQKTYARALYAQKDFDGLAARANGLSAVDQLGLLYDAWALGEAGYEPVSDTLEFASALPADADPIVWRQGVNILVGISAAYGDDPRRAAFDAYARRTLTPLAARVGWDTKPGEDAAISTLRTTLLGALGRFGDASAIAEARKRFANHSALDPGQRRTVIAIVARNATPQEFDQLLAMVRATPDTLQRQRLLEAMAQVSDPALAARVLDIAIGPDTPAGLAPGLVANVAFGHPDLAWNFVQAHDAKGDIHTDFVTRIRMVSGVASASADPARADALKAWADKNVDPGSQRPVTAAIAEIKRNASFRADRLGPLSAWIASHGG
ncbi:MAG TPA: M1 family metallopeptidase [Caulobacteraceae bacterium]|jgi:aminopeptidase N|nr:M1 family metallopeptidase [Caulobacteraceae bacterium]